MFLNLDENNYLLSISKIGGGIKADIDLAEYDFSGLRLNAYKFENERLVFDEEKFNTLETEVQMQEEQSVEQRIKDLEKALELLLSGAVE